MTEKKNIRNSIQKTAIIYSIVAVSVGIMLSLSSTQSSAHVVPEEPWHPVAGAYLRALFYLNLTPINWELISEEFTGRKETGYGLESVYESLSVNDSEPYRSIVVKIKTAIVSQNPSDFYSSSTSAISHLIRHHLNTANELLDNPSLAQNQLLTAQALYRAFSEDWLIQFDPVSFKQIGRNWLSLFSSIGNAGVAGRGNTKAIQSLFETNRKSIESFLIENYESSDQIPLEWYAPTPLNKQTRKSVMVPTPALPPMTNLNDQTPLPRLVLNFEERGIEESDLFLVAYGDMLFDSPEVFGNPAKNLGIACSTCHNRSDINQEFFIPGISFQPGGVDVDGHFFNPRFNDHRNDPLDIPSLRGIRFTQPYGRDGRFASLRDFTRNVIVNEFSGPEPSALMLDSLVSYMIEFDWLPNPLIRRDGSLTPSASRSARRGEKIFTKTYKNMGQISCSSCHDPKSNFIDHKNHDIGSGNPASEGALDSSFDTPTLLNIVFTAPYLHDGSLPTLQAVVDWKEKNYQLNLNNREKRDLVAYIESVGAGISPYETFDEDNTQFQLFWQELNTFSSTLNTLIPAKDAFHANLLVNTVAADLRADAASLLDTSQASMVFELSEKLLIIQEKWEQNDWTASQELWEEYKILAADYGPKFR